MKEYKRILIVRTDRIGDVVLSTPVITNLRSAFPRAYIAFMCRPYTKDALEGNPNLDEVIIYDKYRKHRSFWATLVFGFKLRKKKFDLALILHPTNRVHILTFVAGIRERVGWNRKMGFLLTKKIRHNKQDGIKHEQEYTLDILRSLDIPVEDDSCYFPLKSSSKQTVDGMLSAAGVNDDSKIIVIHPSASCPSKRWPQERFLELIELMKSQFSIKIVLITARGQEEFGAKIVAENGLIDFRGKLSLAETGSLLKRAEIFISNDSGPVHIAAALGVPVISIFGRNDAGLSPARWRPLGKDAYYLHKDPGCSPCLAHNCQKGFLCLKSITPQEVFGVVKKIFDKREITDENARIP